MGDHAACFLSELGEDFFDHHGVVEGHEGEAAENEEESRKEKGLGQDQEQQEGEQIHGGDQEHFGKVGQAQEDGIDDRFRYPAGELAEEGEDHAGEKNQSQGQEGDEDDNGHPAGEAQIGNDAVVQGQHGCEEGDEQPEDSGFAEVFAEGAEEDLAAAVVAVPEGIDTGQHGGGGGTCGEKGQAAEHPEQVYFHQFHKAGAEVEEFGIGGKVHIGHLFVCFLFGIWDGLRASRRARMCGKCMIMYCTVSGGERPLILWLKNNKGNCTKYTNHKRVPVQVSSYGGQKRKNSIYEE